MGGIAAGLTITRAMPGTSASTRYLTDHFLQRFLYILVDEAVPYVLCHLVEMTK